MSYHYIKDVYAVIYAHFTKQNSYTCSYDSLALPCASEL
jgi:hypothetical protein